MGYKHPIVRTLTVEEINERLLRLTSDKAVWEALIEKYGNLEFLVENIDSLKWLRGDRS